MEGYILQGMDKAKVNGEQQFLLLISSLTSFSRAGPPLLKISSLRGFLSFRCSLDGCTMACTFSCVTLFVLHTQIRKDKFFIWLHHITQICLLILYTACVHVCTCTHTHTRTHTHTHTHTHTQRQTHVCTSTHKHTHTHTKYTHTHHPPPSSPPPLPAHTHILHTHKIHTRSSSPVCFFSPNMSKKALHKLQQALRLVILITHKCMNSQDRRYFQEKKKKPKLLQTSTFLLLLLLLLCSSASSLGFTIWVRCLCMWPFCNPTIEVVTFHLRGLHMLDVFLLLAFTCLGHECQDLLSPCDGIHVFTD